MASPSPYYSASPNNGDSLFVSESPSPQRARRPSNTWDQRPSAPPRNPSFTLPPLTPSLLNNSRSPIAQGDPFCQNQHFGQQASGGNLNSVANGNSRQNPQPPPLEIPQLSRHNNFRAPYRYPAQGEEPRLPTPNPAPLTPSRFELPDGENYLSSTPDGGWNFDPSDGFDLNNINIDGSDHFYNWNENDQGEDLFFRPQEAGEQRQEGQGQRREQEERRHNNEVDLTTTSPTMQGATANSSAAGRKRSQPSISPPPAKRTKASNTTSTSAPKSTNEKLDDLFALPPAEDEVDLVNVNDDEDYEKQKEKRKAEEVKRFREEEARRPVKLSKQQCVICLDQPEGLCVTHCGHMFCAECLHGALNTNAMGNRVCPVCRSKINTTPNKNGQMPKTGIFYMQMKLQTRRQGKMAKKT